MMRRSRIGVLVLVLGMAAGLWAQEATEDATPAWTGQVSGGWTSSRGNSHIDNISASASAEKRRERDRMTGGADYGRSSQQNISNGQKTTTEDWWRLTGQYDYFFSPRWFGFVNGRYETDKIALLDYRLLTGAGAGFQWLETERTNLAVSAGLAYQHESYDTVASGSDDTTAQVGYKLSHRIVETVQFVHDLTYYPVIEDLSDYYVVTTGEFRANFTKNMFSNFKVLYSRDASPATGRRNSDIKYILGVGWNF